MKKAAHNVGGIPSLVPLLPLSFQALLNWRNVEDDSVCETGAFVAAGCSSALCGGVFAAPTEYLRMTVK